MTLFEWYLARASGMTAFALLTVSVALGLLLSGRAQSPAWPRFAVEDVHRFAGLLTGAFVSLHVLTLFADAYMPFSVSQLLVPGASSYRPFATAIGVVGAELLLALAIANRYRKRLSYRFWRRTHYLNFAVWGLAFGHGLLSGTDSGSPWASSLYVGSAALVAGLLAYRAGGSRPKAATLPTSGTTSRAA
jgi:methionine sulfoxide reductase heme-binding subunit